MGIDVGRYVDDDRYINDRQCDSTVARGQAVIEVEDEFECCPSVLAAPLDSEEAAELAAAFSALGDPARLQLLSMLAAAPDGEICVCEFIETHRQEPRHHLPSLEDPRRCRTRHSDRRGKWVWYSVDRERFAMLRSALDG